MRRECTNHYILLLIPFAVAGVLLIVFLSLTDMTVAAGTINGLLFYANVVMQNKATFFHPNASESFLAVFMAWLNLDFGINSCFYDGLDAYVYMWLQFSFPMYIWFLAIAIILACRHFDFMNKLCGTNIVQVSEGELSLLVSDSQWHQALTTEDMEALEYFGVSVGVQTNGTVELLFYSLETFSHFTRSRQD